MLIYQNAPYTKLFIDCEFNDFRGDLISLALVPEAPDGPYFYEVLDCPKPSPWVAQHVMPILHKVAVPREVFQHALHAYLRQFPGVHLIADWPEDIKHFCDALITGPGQRLNTPPLFMEVRRDLDAESAVPHNALYDARAIRRKYLELHGDA